MNDPEQLQEPLLAVNTDAAADAAAAEAIDMEYGHQSHRYDDDATGQALGLYNNTEHTSNRTESMENASVQTDTDDHDEDDDDDELDSRSVITASSEQEAFRLLRSLVWGLWMIVVCVTMGVVACKNRSNKSAARQIEEQWQVWQDREHELYSYIAAAQQSLPWPTATVVNLPTHQESANDETMLWLPVVTESTRDAWQTYAEDNWSDWANSTTVHVPDDIMNAVTQAPSTGTPLLPLWQVHPVPQDLSTWINIDALTVPDWSEGLKNCIYENDNVFVVSNGDLNVWQCWAVQSENSTLALLIVAKPLESIISSVLGSHVRLMQADWSSSDNQTMTTTHVERGTAVQLQLGKDIFLTVALPPQRIWSAGSVGWMIVLVMTVLLFGLYDVVISRHRHELMQDALQSSAVVASLFPEQFRERVMLGSGEMGTAAAAAAAVAQNNDDSSYVMFEPNKSRLKDYLLEENEADGTGPMADLFPACTVLFADIAGFTAWSSLRDPAQVFVLLEAVYSAFDKLARKHDVFKVETVGDSYVAVTGLPEAQPDHAWIMCKFARDCRTKMNALMPQLELRLGPETSDLQMRFGMHSGPVTAGVLRGEKSRFQLFGDTVNTAARMESTGIRDQIQLSEASAQLVVAAGRGHYVRPRDTKVHAKGKGELQTFWLQSSNSRRSLGSTGSDGSSGVSSGHSSLKGPCVIWGEEAEHQECGSSTTRSKHMRLIEYNTDIMANLVRNVLVQRKVLKMTGCTDHDEGDNGGGKEPPVLHERVDSHNLIDEVAEVIDLPAFDPRAYGGYVDPETVELEASTMSQLKSYVTIIGAMYRSNPFHNFEHASHVVMAVNKLLSRVVAPDLRVRRKSLVMMTTAGETGELASDLHQYTYGITSDPLTQLAIVFAALIHDVDHWGVSNQQMVVENTPLAVKYQNKSVAEQNSVNLAWNLLMDEDYKDLHKVLFTTQSEYDRFRQVVVNVVMATDIFDSELVELRTNRWNKAFREEQPLLYDPDGANRKATIVIEHIMQASDVTHTMQHWHIYQKWNRRLFDEQYTAFCSGRMSEDPSINWFQGEMKFFDGYIIPLAKKLKECGVFGVASEECLNYALNNRAEWLSKGEQIVCDLVNNYKERETEEAERRMRESNGQSHQQEGKKPSRKRFTRRRSLFATGM